MAESPGPLALREFLEVGGGGVDSGQREPARKKRPCAHGVQGNPHFVLSGHGTRVVAAQLQLCPVEFPELKRNPRQAH